VAGRFVAVRTLRLYIDCLASKSAPAAPLAAASRVIYVREGAATIRAAGQAVSRLRSPAARASGLIDRARGTSSRSTIEEGTASLPHVVPSASRAG